jgi:hypothetical protein
VTEEEKAAKRIINTAIADVVSAARDVANNYRSMPAVAKLRVRVHELDLLLTALPDGEGEPA